MKIPVVGFDPSLANWGIAEAILDLNTGVLSTPVLSIIQPRDDAGKKKQVRKNSLDLERAEQLAEGVFTAASRAKVIFVEVPHGSQSARAMASYGICIGILGSLRSQGRELIEVSDTENKKCFTGSKTATKDDMIRTAVEWYPTANWPRVKKTQAIIESKAEHMADAVAAIHAGVHTPMFQNLMRLFTATTKE